MNKENMVNRLMEAADKLDQWAETGVAPLTEAPTAELLRTIAGTVADVGCPFCVGVDEHENTCYVTASLRLADKVLEGVHVDGRYPQREDARKPVRDAIARTICDSEPFMWLMVGANHPEAHLADLREAYSRYNKQGGGYGNWNNRTISEPDS